MVGRDPSEWISHNVKCTAIIYRNIYKYGSHTEKDALYKLSERKKERETRYIKSRHMIILLSH